MKFTSNSRLVFTFLVFLAVLSAVSSVAANDAETIAELKKQIKVLQQRVDELEARQSNPSSAASAPSADAYTQDWNPYEEINRMQEEMDQMFHGNFNRSEARSGVLSSQLNFDYETDVKETDAGYEIRFDMTGLDQEKVDVQVNRNSLTIKGEQSLQETQKGPQSVISSKSFGSFMKTIPLPVDADTAKAETIKEGESLVIKLPKKK